MSEKLKNLPYSYQEDVKKAIKISINTNRNMAASLNSNKMYGEPPALVQSHPTEL